MKERVIKYLDKNYYFNFKTINTHQLLKKDSNLKLKTGELMDELRLIFMLTEDELFDIFDEWADKEFVRLNNAAVDYKTQYFKEHGVEPTNSTIDDLVKACEPHVHI